MGKQKNKKMDGLFFFSFFLFLFWVSKDGGRILLLNFVIRWIYPRAFVVPWHGWTAWRGVWVSVLGLFGDFKVAWGFKLFGLDTEAC